MEHDQTVSILARKEIQQGRTDGTAMNFEEIIKTINIKPYYKDESVAIYCSDCREALPLLPDKSIDLVLTDPPYLGLTGGLLFEPNRNNAFSKSVGDLWGANLEWTEIIKDKVKLGYLVFCSYHFLPELAVALDSKHKALITWYKRNSPLSVRNVPHFTTEYIWAIAKDAGLRWRELETFYDIPTLNYSSNERVKLPNSHSALHPTQKPEKLVSQLLLCSTPEMIILDPFLGSGTTLACAKKLGRKAIGIEIEEKYCRIAAERCAQTVLSLTPLTNSKKEQAIL